MHADMLDAFIVHSFHLFDPAIQKFRENCPHPRHSFPSHTRGPVAHVLVVPVMSKELKDAHTTFNTHLC